MSTIMQELYKVPLPANTHYLALVWCKHVTAKIQQAELLHKISPFRDFHGVPSLRLFNKDHYEPSTFFRSHHKQSPHSFYPKMSQNSFDSMKLLTPLSGPQFETCFLRSAFLWVLPVISQSTSKIIHWISSHISRLPLHLSFCFL